jgi:hypothetical protein
MKKCIQELLLMNSFPNFDMKNSREYPHFDNAPIPRGNVSTRQRIVQCFNSKVIFWAALALFTTGAFFENPLVSAVNSHLMGNRLLFVGGLMLGVCEGVLLQKRNAANLAPVWLRIALAIMILVASFLVVHFLGNNSFFASLCAGAVAGSGVWYAIAAYRSNWAVFS